MLGRTAARAGWVTGSCRAPSPLPTAPAHCNLLLRGGFKQLKMEAVRQEPGLTAPQRSACEAAITTGHYTHGAISER